MRDGKRRKNRMQGRIRTAALSVLLAVGFLFLGCVPASWAGQAAAVGVSGKSGNGGEAPGESTPPDENLPADLDSLPGLLGIEEELGALDQFLGDAGGAGPSGSFWDIVKKAASGDADGLLLLAGQRIEELFLGEMLAGGKLLAQAASIGILGAVFTHISSAFKGRQVSDAGFFACYLLLFACLAASFLASLDTAARSLDQILEFMRLLMPAYFLAVAFAGGSMTALAMYEVCLGAVALVQWLCGDILLSLVKIYVLLILGSHAVKEPFLTKLTGLLEQVVDWSLKTLVGLVAGFHLIQALVLPYADGAAQAGARRLLELVPGLGAGAGAVAQLVLGSGVLIKNSIGTAGAIILGLLTLAPAVKLGILMLLYQCVAAVMEPVCDKRMVSCVSGMARGHKMLLKIQLYSLFLFLLAIAITCGFTNVSYFAA